MEEIQDSPETSTDVFFIKLSDKTSTSINQIPQMNRTYSRVRVDDRKNRIQIQENKKALPENSHISQRYFWSGGTGIIFALLNSCFVFCAVPQHHIFLVPNAWHEFVTTSAIGFMGLFATSLILNCEIWMNIKTVKTWRNFLFLYFGCALVWILANIGYYHVYVIMMGLSPPLPLNIHVCGTFTLGFAVSFFWYLIPYHTRSETNFWKRYRFYMLAQLFRYVAVLEYFVLTWMFVTVEDDYQWIVAILLPILREVNAWVLVALCYKSAGTRNNAIKITATHEMACRHAVFLSVALSLLATQRTAFICIGLDFAVNLVLCIQIIWRTRKKKQLPNIEDDTDLQELALNEKTVYIVPLAYFICFLVAYFGPNSRIIGNVGNTSWHFGKVNDIWPPVFIMLLMFLIDLVGIAVWTFLLKIFCNITYLKGYMHIQKKYWFIMAIHEAYSLNEVSNLNESKCVLVYV